MFLRDIPANRGLESDQINFELDARAVFPDTVNQTKTSEKSLPLVVVEPRLENRVFSSVGTSRINDAGDNVTFTIQIQHTNKSTAIAYRVRISLLSLLSGGKFCRTYILRFTVNCKLLH